MQCVVKFQPEGRYLWAGSVLVDTKSKDHVPLEFCGADERMSESFKVAGQGMMSTEALDRIGAHRSVVYLQFPLDLPEQRERVLKYSALMRDLGGIAVKVESCGKAHDWERWFGLLTGLPSQRYKAVVTLVADEDYYYSCGMHHFGLPDCEVPSSLPLQEASDLVDAFNNYLLAEKPILVTGHTFSLAQDAPHYRLTHHEDERHTPDEDDLFWNSYGLWKLDAV